MVIDDFCLKGKVALVTGGGSGIGYGIASGLMEAGASLVCVYKRNEIITTPGRERYTSTARPFRLMADI